MASSISLPFKFNSSGGVDSTGVSQKIWSDLVLGVLFTMPTNRVMRPTYGSDVLSAVWEPQDSVVELVTRAVSSAFSRYLPALTFIGVTVSEEDAGLGDEGLIISVDYQLPNKQIDSVTTKIGTFTRAGELIQEIQ
jgi:phage baseplate assembly protein W